MPVRTAQAALERYWDRQLPIDPVRIARAAGAVVRTDNSMRLLDLSGSFDAQDEVQTICYNPDDSEVRQRFTVAHELGHMLLRHGPSFKDSAIHFSSGIQSIKEREANSFAMELLMPKEVLDWLVYKEKVHDVEAMAVKLKVSGAALHYRLVDLGYLR
jgi:Zn-dependent peptidase ImmA (M78 family)